MAEAPEHRSDAAVATADPTAYNVAAIAKLEADALRDRTASERMSDVVTGFVGTMGFVVFHIVLFAAWAAVNTRLLPIIQPFDPFPFGILTLIVSTEGVFLAIFILISQNRMSRQADRRAHLSLQVSMLAEQELTMLLRLQEKISRRLGIEVEQVEAEARNYMDQTNVEELLTELQEKLPED
jgi:uncharacterized membrane protein